MRTTFFCCLVMGCAAQQRVQPPEGEPPRRLVLSVAEPFERITVGGIELAVHDSDPTSGKPVLLCLHAIGHGGSDFARLERDFASTHRIISLDWPGHGQSSGDTVPASAARYTALLAELVDSMQLSTFTVLGNSIGGAVAIAYAAAHPTRVRALILANPGGLDSGASGFFGKLIIGNYVSHFEQGARNEAAFEPWFREYYQRVLPMPAADAQRNAIIAASFEMAPILVQAWESFRQPEADVSSLLPSLPMPVLVTWASRDTVISWGRNHEAIERIPRVKIVFFEAGHAAFLEAPDAFTAELRAFFATLR